MDFSDGGFVEPTFDQGPDGREGPGGVDYVEFTHLLPTGKNQSVSQSVRWRGKEGDQVLVIWSGRDEMMGSVGFNVRIQDSCSARLYDHKTKSQSATYPSSPLEKKNHSLAEASWT